MIRAILLHLAETLRFLTFAPRAAPPAGPRGDMPQVPGALRREP